MTLFWKIILGLVLAAKIEVMQENSLIVKLKKWVKISANVFAICPCSFFNYFYFTLNL